MIERDARVCDQSVNVDKTDDDTLRAIVKSSLPKLSTVVKSLDELVNIFNTGHLAEDEQPVLVEGFWFFFDVLLLREVIKYGAFWYSFTDILILSKVRWMVEREAYLEHLRVQNSSYCINNAVDIGSGNGAGEEGRRGGRGAPNRLLRFHFNMF